MAVVIDDVKSDRLKLKLSTSGASRISDDVFYGQKSNNYEVCSKHLYFWPMAVSLDEPKAPLNCSE